MLLSGTLIICTTEKMYSSITLSTFLFVYIYRLALFGVFIKQQQNVVNTALNDVRIRSG